MPTPLSHTRGQERGRPSSRKTAQQLGNLGSISSGIGSGYNATGQLGLGTAGMYGTLGTLQGTTGQALGSLGSTAANMGALNQSSLISGASAGLQGATLQQQNAQQQDTAAYNQYMAGLSYPFQNVGFLSNVVQGRGCRGCWPWSTPVLKCRRSRVTGGRGMLIFQAAGSDEETYIDPAAIIAIEDKGAVGTLVHLSGGQTIVVDALPSKIVAQMSEVGISVRVPSRVK